MELAEGVEEGAFGLLDGMDPLVARLRSKPRSHNGLSSAGGEQFLTIGLTCGGDFASNPGTYTAWIGDSGLRETPGVKAKPQRALQGPGGQWRSVAAVAQSLGVTELRWRGGSRALSCTGGCVRRKGDRGYV